MLLEVALGLLILAFSFGLGATLPISDFLQVAKGARKSVLTGFASQFGMMPLIAFVLAHIFDFSDAHAIGLILTGSCPGGTSTHPTHALMFPETHAPCRHPFPS